MTEEKLRKANSLDQRIKAYKERIRVLDGGDLDVELFKATIRHNGRWESVNLRSYCNLYSKMYKFILMKETLELAKLQKEFDEL